MIIGGEYAPHFSWVARFAGTKLEFIKRNTLAIKHPANIVIWLDDELCRIGKGIVLRKPCRLRMDQPRRKLPFRYGYLSGKEAHLLVTKKPTPP